MKILVVHNYYQHAGGEDTVFAAECRMLSENGHEVIQYKMDNHVIDGMGRLSLIAKTIWNQKVYREFQTLIAKEKPDIAHFHNTFPLISPSAYYACKRMKVPVVQTLHNYRLTCLNACLLYRNAICEKCLGRTPWYGIFRKCYRNNLAASIVAFSTLVIHRFLGTYRKQIDAYIALTEFGRTKMIQAGLPEKKVVVKPNVVFSSERVSFPSSPRDATVIYAGRLSPEKGIDLLIDVWANIINDDCIRSAFSQRPKLLIIGDGPEKETLEQRVNTYSVNSTVEFAGKLQHSALLDKMRTALLLVLPSRWYEGFPMTIVEGFTQSLPAIVPNVGGHASIVQEDVTGFHFEIGNISDLERVLRHALSDPSKLKSMGENAFDFIHASDSMPSRNVNKLLDIYHHCILQNQSRL